MATNSTIGWFRCTKREYPLADSTWNKQRLSKPTSDLEVLLWSLLAVGVGNTYVPCSFARRQWTRQFHSLVSVVSQGSVNVDVTCLPSCNHILVIGLAVILLLVMSCTRTPFSLSLSLCLFVSVSICLSLPVCLSFRPSVYLSVFLPACLPVCLSICLSVCLSLKRPQVFSITLVKYTLFIHWCIHSFPLSVSVCLSVCFCLSVCLSVSLSVSVCLSVCLSVSERARVRAGESQQHSRSTVSFSEELNRGSSGTKEFVACNHLRSYHFFIESINSPCPFEGFACSSEDHFNVSWSPSHAR